MCREGDVTVWLIYFSIFHCENITSQTHLRQTSSGRHLQQYMKQCYDYNSPGEKNRNYCQRPRPLSFKGSVSIEKNICPFFTTILYTIQRKYSTENNIFFGVITYIYIFFIT